MAREKHRTEILNRLPKGGIGAEIGVWEGGFSARLLEIAKPTTLHLIDPWEFQPEFTNTAFGRARNETRMGDKYELVKDKFKDDPRVVLHRAFSDVALEQFEDNTLDWVYVDGNHNFEIVFKDLQLCAAKVKPGGVIAGDDLLWKKDEGAPVQKAVRRFRKTLEQDGGFYRFGQQYLFELAA